MKHFLLLFICITSYQLLPAQNITAQIIEKNTKAPVPFATIKTGEHSGTISNEEGFFTISTSDYHSITISCVGFESKTLSINSLKDLNYVITLETAINQLDEVYVSNKKPNIDSIIVRIKRHTKQNYSIASKRYDIFRRSTDYVDFEHLDFEIDKATHVKKQQLEQANTDLQALTNAIMNSKTVHFTDFKGTLYTKTKDSTKLVVNKATQLLDHDKDFSVDKVQERAQYILLSYLDTTKTYKVKTGLFKIEDSISFQKEFSKEQENTKKEEFTINTLKSDTRKLINTSQWLDGSFLMNFLDTRLYNHSIENITVHNGNLTYIINYEPRRGKAKYHGKLFVNENDYAITKVDYSYFENKHGQKLNLKFLLGVKYEENLHNGMLLYQKEADGTYQPKYIKEEEGRYFYVSRDLTLIENSKGRYKLSTDFTIEGHARSKEELLVTSTKNISLNDYDDIVQEKKVPYQTLTRFDKTIWESEETLEPLQEMKAFGAE